MAKVFKDGKWQDSTEPYVPVKTTAKPLFKDGKWSNADPASSVPEPPKVFVDPRDIEPQPPRPPENDHDRPRWVAENVRYMEAVGTYRSRQKFKADHPELKGISWHVATE